MKLRPTRRLLLLAVLAGCDRIQPDLPTEAPAGNRLASEQLRVAPDTLQFFLFKADYDWDLSASDGAAPTVWPGAGQAFPGGGVARVESGNVLDGDGVVPEAVTTVQTLVLTNDGATPMVWSAGDNVDWLSVSPSSGTLAAGASSTLEVTVDSASLTIGGYQTQIVLTAGSATHRVPVAVSVLAGAVLWNGQTVFIGLEGTYWLQGFRYYYVLSVPAGVELLTVSVGTVYSRDGVDLYVRRGEPPTGSRVDCAPPTNSPRNEACYFATPAPGDYFITVEGDDLWEDGWAARLTAHYRFPYVPTLPRAPSNLTATAAGAQRVAVRWQLNSYNVDALRVRRSTRNPDGTFAAYRTVSTRGGYSDSFTDTTVMLGTTYRYRVEVCDHDLCATSAPSGPITVVAPPGPAASLRATVLPGPRIDLSWSGTGSRALTYQVWRSARRPDGSYPPYTWISITHTSTYSDTSVVAGQRYAYHVRGCNDFGCTASRPVNAYVPLPPAAPSGLRALHSVTQADLSWTDASTNESSFRVRRSTRNPDGTLSPAQTIGTLPAGSSRYTDAGITAGNAYRYQVQACNASGCASSAWAGVTIPGS